MRKGNQKRLHKQASIFKNTNFIKLHNVMKLLLTSAGSNDMFRSPTK